MTMWGPGLTPIRSLALVVISDRGDLYLPRCLESIKRHLHHPVAQRITIDDPYHRYTASGAVNAAWRQVRDDIDFVWHQEEDFLLTEEVDIEGMASVLAQEPQLASLCLLRQPWSPPELEAGGIVEMSPQDYTDRKTRGHPWLEHRKWFSLNPSLVPRRVFEQGFPEGSEPAQTQRLLDQGYVFGYWGARGEAPRVEHIGELRAVGSVR